MRENIINKGILAKSNIPKSKFILLKYSIEISKIIVNINAGKYLAVNS